VRSAAGLCLVVLALAGCGGSDDRPDLAAPPPTTETLATVPTTTEAAGSSQTVTAVRMSTRLRPGERHRIAEQAGTAATAVRTWNSRLDSCTRRSRKARDVGATCTRGAWEQLFKQMYAVQYELLALSDQIGAGPCHAPLASAIDAVHGFLAGATPLNVAWLDDQQRPPSVYDLESIVDLIRPVPESLRTAEAACAG
jgi:hypothetical protein